MAPREMGSRGTMGAGAAMQESRRERRKAADT